MRVGVDLQPRLVLQGDQGAARLAAQVKLGQRAARGGQIENGVRNRRDEADVLTAEQAALTRFLPEYNDLIKEIEDILAETGAVEPVETGEFLAMMSAGAYGFAMSSNYNSRPRSAEVLVDGDNYFVIRDRETYDDLVKNERIPQIILSN